MGTYVTPTGLQIPTLAQIMADLSAQQRGEIDPLLNTDPDDPVGNINASVASALIQGWEVLQIAWNANNPNGAEGVLLEFISAITGTLREPATPSALVGTRKVKVNLTSGTVLTAGKIFAVAGDPTIEFQTIEDVTANAGTGNYFVAAECTQVGPVTCNAGTLTIIVSAFSGLNSVTNDFDAVKGTLQDTDPQLRLRREKELRATGNATVDAIQATLLAYTTIDKVQPILDARVFENVNDFPVDGLPGHSMLALVFDGVSMSVANNVIAQLLWNVKGGGIKFIGSSSGVAVDKLGDNHSVAFTRPTMREIIFTATLTLVDPLQTPSQYATTVKAAILAEFAIRVRIGSVIRCNHYERVVLNDPGIDDCVVQIGPHGGVVAAPGVNFTLAVTEMGFTQTADVTVS